MGKEPNQPGGDAVVAPHESPDDAGDNAASPVDVSQQQEAAHRAAAQRYARLRSRRG